MGRLIFIVVMVCLFGLGCSESIDKSKSESLSIISENYESAMFFPGVLKVSGPGDHYHGSNSFDDISGYLDKVKNLTKVECSGIYKEADSIAVDKYERHEKSARVYAELDSCYEKIKSERAELLKDASLGYLKYRVPLVVGEYSLWLEAFRLCSSDTMLIEASRKKYSDTHELSDNEHWIMSIIPSHEDVANLGRKAFQFNFRDLLMTRERKPLGFMTWRPDGKKCLEFPFPMDEAKEKEKGFFGETVFLEFLGDSPKLVDTGKKYTDLSADPIVQQFTGFPILGVKMKVYGYRLVDSQDKALTQWFALSPSHY